MGVKLYPLLGAEWPALGPPFHQLHPGASCHFLIMGPPNMATHSPLNRRSEGLCQVIDPPLDSILYLVSLLMGAMAVREVAFEKWVAELQDFLGPVGPAKAASVDFNIWWEGGS